MPIGDAEREAAATVLREAGIEGPFAIINAGAGWPSKLWPPERFAAVARHLGHQRHLPVIVVWAGEEERSLASRIVAGSDSQARLAPPILGEHTEEILRTAGYTVEEIQAFREAEVI